MAKEDEFTNASAGNLDAILNSPHDPHRQWYVLHTKPRQEKSLADELARTSIEHFLPLVRYRRTYGGRIRHVQIPLFPGYLFLFGDSPDRQAALRTNRVANVLDVPDQQRFQNDLGQ